jgi:hypothetical protein
MPLCHRGATIEEYVFGLDQGAEKRLQIPLPAPSDTGFASLRASLPKPRETLRSGLIRH